MGDTIIAWTEKTLNLWMGCHKVSPGCKHCYAETLTKNRMGLNVWGPTAPRKRTAKSTWDQARRWNREAEQRGLPIRVFCGSLMDWAEDHKSLDGWRREMWQLIRETPWLRWQLLTKRSDRIQSLLPPDWGAHGYSNVWLGVSVEDMAHAGRADDLRVIPAPVRFISYEPALGPLDGISLDGIDWLIVGGESGPGYREMPHEWARAMRSACLKSKTAFFFKQSSAPRTEMGIELDGKIVREYPIERKDVSVSATR